MGHERSLKAFERLYLTLLSASALGLSMASECNDFNMKNVNNGGGNWQFYMFSDSEDCFLCYRYQSNGMQQSYADLVLPCLDQNVSSVKISYLVRRGGNSRSKQGGKPLSVHEEEGKPLCQNDSSSITNINKSYTEELQQPLSNLESDVIQVQGINLTTSNRLKIVSDYFQGRRSRNFIICLKNVEFSLKQQQSGLQVWLILVPVLISILMLGTFVAVGVVIRQRKLQVRRKKAKVDDGKEDKQSRQTRDHTTSDKQLIFKPSFGQDLNDKNIDDHSYCEIDIKPTTKNDLIYNSAYESVSSVR